MLTINYSFVTLGALIDLARAFIFPLKLSTAPPFRSLVPASPSNPTLSTARPYSLLDGLRSFESKIQISVEILSSRTNPPDYPRLFTTFRSLDHPLLLRSSGTRCTLVFPSLPLSVSRRHFFFFLSRYFSIPLTLVSAFS